MTSTPPRSYNNKKSPVYEYLITKQSSIAAYVLTGHIYMIKHIL